MGCVSLQSYKLTNGVFMPRDWITEKWDQGYYITAVAGATHAPGNDTLAVISKHTLVALKIVLRIG